MFYRFHGLLSQHFERFSVHGRRTDDVLKAYGGTSPQSVKGM